MLAKGASSQRDQPSSDRAPVDAPTETEQRSLESLQVNGREAAAAASLPYLVDRPDHGLKMIREVLYRLEHDYRGTHKDALLSSIRAIYQSSAPRNRGLIDGDTWKSLEVAELVTAILPRGESTESQALTLFSLVSILLEPSSGVEQTRFIQAAIENLYTDPGAFDAIDVFLNEPAVQDLLEITNPPGEGGDWYEWHKTNRDLLRRLSEHVARLPDFNSDLLNALISILRDVRDTDIAKHYAHGTTRTSLGIRPSCDAPQSWPWQRFNPDHAFESNGVVDKLFQAGFLAASLMYGPEGLVAAIGVVVALEGRHRRIRNHDVSMVLMPLMEMAQEQLAPALNAISHLKGLLAFARFLKNSKLPVTPVNFDDGPGMELLAQGMGSPLHTKDPKFALNDVLINSDTPRVLGGANNAGKTSFTKGIGQNVLLGLTFGWFVAKEARMSPPTSLTYVATGPSKSSDNRGKLSKGLQPLKEVLEKRPDNRTLLLIDEIGAGGQEQAVAPVIANILKRFQELGVRVLVVHHNASLRAALAANGLEVIYLMAESLIERRADGSSAIINPYRIVGEADARTVHPNVYVAAVARELGLDPETLWQKGSGEAPNSAVVG